MFAPAWKYSYQGYFNHGRFVWRYFHKPYGIYLYAECVKQSAITYPNHGEETSATMNKTP